MSDFFTQLVSAPLPTILVLSGILFFFVGGIGHVSAKAFEINLPDLVRITFVIAGVTLLIVGIGLSIIMTSPKQGVRPAKKTQDPQQARQAAPSHTDTTEGHSEGAVSGGPKSDPDSAACPDYAIRTDWQKLSIEDLLGYVNVASPRVKEPSWERVVPIRSEFPQLLMSVYEKFKGIELHGGPLSGLPIERAKLDACKAKLTRHNEDKARVDHYYFVSKTLYQVSDGPVQLSLEDWVDALMGVFVFNDGQPHAEIIKRPIKLDRTLCIDVDRARAKRIRFLALVYPLTARAYKTIKSLQFEQYVKISVMINGVCYETYH